MNTFLRYEPGTVTPELETVYDFSSTEGIIRAAEKCNGSGDCRKSIKAWRNNVSQFYGNNG